jgi:hypothetical protein
MASSQRPRIPQRPALQETRTPHPVGHPRWGSVSTESVGEKAIRTLAGFRYACWLDCLSPAPRRDEGCGVRGFAMGHAVSLIGGSADVVNRKTLKALLGEAILRDTRAEGDENSDWTPLEDVECNYKWSYNRR